MIVKIKLINTLKHLVSLVPGKYSGNVRYSYGQSFLKCTSMPYKDKKNDLSLRNSPIIMILLFF